MSFQQVFRTAKPMRKAAPELEDMGGGRAASRLPLAQPSQGSPDLSDSGSPSYPDSVGAGRRITPAMSDQTGGTGRPR
jgi:hypothetical protein